MGFNDNDILSALRQDPEEGFRMLAEKYGELLYWHIRRLVSLHADAQDATQETFVRIFRSFRHFKNDCSFKSWLYKIATNEALRILSQRGKRQSALSELPDGGELDMPADEYTDFSDLEAVKLQRAIQSLPEKQRLAFNLRYYDELGYEEIAEIAGSTVAAVKANYHFAKEKIVEYMNTHD